MGAGADSLVENPGGSRADPFRIPYSIGPSAYTITIFSGILLEFANPLQILFRQPSDVHRDLERNAVDNRRSPGYDPDAYRCVSAASDLCRSLSCT